MGSVTLILSIIGWCFRGKGDYHNNVLGTLQHMRNSNATLSALLVALLMAWGILSYFLISSHSKSLKSISQSDHAAIEKTIASLTDITGTNISAIQKLSPNRVRVYTISMSEIGGDILELEKEHGDWLLQKKGVWIP